MDRAVDAANLATPGVDLSLWGLFLEADIVVKVVMLGLLAASVWVWAVVFEKWSSLRKVNRDADGFEDRFWSGGSLEELFEHEATNPAHPMAAVFGAAMGEWRRSVRVAGADISRTSVRERIDRAITVTVQREMDRMERWMIFLASVGATAPFIGLFGYCVGNYALVLRNRGHAQHQSRRGGARHRRGTVRHGDRSGGSNSGSAGLQ